MYSRFDLLDYTTFPTVAAFLRLLREGESSQLEDAYTMLYGGGHFSGFDDHPRIRFYEKDDEFIRNNRKDYTTAAGAYQFTATTWDGLVRQYGFPSFAPSWQDAAAVALVLEVDALADVMAGRVEAAIAKCGSKWASLPSSTVGQPTIKLQRALDTYNTWLTRYKADNAERTAAVAAAQEPTEAPQVAIELRQEAPMPAPLVPIFAALLPELLKQVPMLSSLFPSSEVATRNVAAATAVAEAVVKATAAPNLQAAVDKLSTDPDARKAATDAIGAMWPALTDVGGGVETARRANVAGAGIPLRRDRAFLVTLLFAPLIYFVVVAVMGDWGWARNVTPETRSMVIGFVMGTAFASMLAYWYGTSAGSQAKDNRMRGTDRPMV